VLRAPARPSNKASSMRQSIACFSQTRRATIDSAAAPITAGSTNLRRGGASGSVRAESRQGSRNRRRSQVFRDRRAAVLHRVIVAWRRRRARFIEVSRATFTASCPIVSSRSFQSVPCATRTVAKVLWKRFQRPPKECRQRVTVRCFLRVNAPVLPPRSRGSELVQRTGWTFMLGTCAREFLGSACLPIACPTVTCMGGSLRDAGLSDPLLICFMSEPFVPNLGCSSYIGNIPHPMQVGVERRKTSLERAGVRRGVSAAPSTSVMEAVRGRDGPPVA
jgi:hypothetical protein